MIFTTFLQLQASFFHYFYSVSVIFHTCNKLKAGIEISFDDVSLYMRLTGSIKIMQYLLSPFPVKTICGMNHAFDILKAVKCAWIYAPKKGEQDNKFNLTQARSLIQTALRFARMLAGVLLNAVIQ